MIKIILKKIQEQSQKTNFTQLQLQRNCNDCKKIDIDYKTSIIKTLCEWQKYRKQISGRDDRAQKETQTNTAN